LLAVGAPPRTVNGTPVAASVDTYFDGYLQVDAKVQYDINKNLAVYFEGNNVNDGPFVSMREILVILFRKSITDHPLPAV